MLLVYEIWRIYVKITFLNNYLDESIYKMQLDGFIAKRGHSINPFGMQVA